MRSRSIGSLLACCCLVLGACANAGPTVEIAVEFDEEADFSVFETFTVLTPELVPEADTLDTDAKLFNEEVNELIVDAMTGPPVCMRFIPPEEVVEGNEPDLFAGNGLRQTTGEGTVWQCVGGWWWGAWGWFWDPCLWRAPVNVEIDIGSLYLPVGPRPEEGTSPEPVFRGTAQTRLRASSDVDEKVRAAVRATFQQWPERRTCSP